MVIELTDGAISKAIERTETGNRSGIRLGVTGGGCAGFEYYIESVSYTHLTLPTTVRV